MLIWLANFLHKHEYTNAADKSIQFKCSNCNLLKTSIGCQQQSQYSLINCLLIPVATNCKRNHSIRHSHFAKHRFSLVRIHKFSNTSKRWSPATEDKTNFVKVNLHVNVTTNELAGWQHRKWMEWKKKKINRTREGVFCVAQIAKLSIYSRFIHSLCLHANLSHWNPTISGWCCWITFNMQMPDYKTHIQFSDVAARLKWLPHRSAIEIT